MHPSPRVKICGLTSVEQALAVAAAGADAIGLVFYAKSLRYVTPSLAADISQSLPPFIQKVGLFVNESASVIYTLLDNVYLDVLQFHGEESADFCRQFKKPYIKTLHVSASVNLEKAMNLYPDASAFLLDVFDKKAYGGTGRTFNWNLFPEKSTKPLILAGGLSPVNVVDAINKCQPYAVDTSSGVEITPGDKSLKLVQQFVEQVKSGKQ